MWPEIWEQLRTNPALEAKTVFAALQRQYGAMIREADFNPLHGKASEAMRRLRMFIRLYRLTALGCSPRW